MDKYYVRFGQRIYGPVGAEQLRHMADTGQITDVHMISTNGRDWVSSRQVQGLFSDPGDSFASDVVGMAVSRAESMAQPPSTVPNHSADYSCTRRPRKQMAAQISDDRRRIDVPDHSPWTDASEYNDAFTQATPSPGPAAAVCEHSRVQPSQANARSHIHGLQSPSATEGQWEYYLLVTDEIKHLIGSGLFWSIATIGVLPLFINSINEPELRLKGLMFFFALVWGAIFRRTILRDSEPVYLSIGAFFFTGVLGMAGLLYAYETIMPASYINMWRSPDPFVRLAGFVAQVGLCEEILKLIPVWIYLVWKQRRSVPITAIAIGVFSGLGFGAFENLDYGGRVIALAIDSTLEGFQQGGVDGSVSQGSIGAMIAISNVILRSLSLIFAHALWSGMAAYFVMITWMGVINLWAGVALVLVVPALLHGVYDWFCGMQQALAATVIGMSLLFFFGHLNRFRSLDNK